MRGQRKKIETHVCVRERERVTLVDMIGKLVDGINFWSCFAFLPIHHSHIKLQSRKFAVSFLSAFLSSLDLR